MTIRSACSLFSPIAFALFLGGMTGGCTADQRTYDDLGSGGSVLEDSNAGGGQGGGDAAPGAGGAQSGGSAGQAAGSGGVQTGGAAGQAAGAGGEQTGGAAGQTGGAGGGTPGEPNRVRIVAANLTSGTSQSYDTGHGQRILQGLKPDIVLLQEFNYKKNTTSELREFIDDTFGVDFSYTRGNGTIPNGVVSRYPILQSGEWKDPSVDNRGLTWANIDVPGSRDLLAISVHFLASKAAQRNKTANELIAMIGTVGPNDLVVLGGDFNTDSRTESCITTLSSHFVTAGPYPADQADNSFTSAPRTKPLDWVLPSPALHSARMPVVIGSNSFANGLVLDTRVYKPIADVAPAQKGDSAADQMQHMAVVRDFDIQ